MKKMIFAISVFVMSAGGQAVMAVTGAEMASLGNTLMGGFQGVMAAQQIGKQADQSAADLDRQMEEANKAASAATAGQEVKPPVVLPTIKGNYPIVDPFANPQYWNARTTQSQASMQAAATNSKIMNQKAVEAIDAEFQQTKAMMQAIGGVMEQGGTMMQSMGAKMAEAEKLEADKQRTDLVTAAGKAPKCGEGVTSGCVRAGTEEEGGGVIYVDDKGNNNKMTEQEIKAVQQGQQQTAYQQNVLSQYDYDPITGKYTHKTTGKEISSIDGIAAHQQEIKAEAEKKAAELKAAEEEAEKIEHNINKVEQVCNQVKQYNSGYQCPSTDKTMALWRLEDILKDVRAELDACRGAKGCTGSISEVENNNPG
jgi:hypothetical protein